MGRKEERKLHTDNPNHKRKRIPEFGLSRDGTLDQWQIISHCYENMSRVPKEGLLQSYEPATGNLMPVHKLTHSERCRPTKKDTAGICSRGTKPREREPPGRQFAWSSRNEFTNLFQNQSSLQIKEFFMSSTTVPPSFSFLLFFCGTVVEYAQEEQNQEKENHLEDSLLGDPEMNLQISSRTNLQVLFFFCLVVED